MSVSGMNQFAGTMEFTNIRLDGFRKTIGLMDYCVVRIFG